STRRHTRSKRDWSSDVCSSDLCMELNNSWAPASSQRTTLPTLVSMNPPTGTVSVSTPEDIASATRARCQTWSSSLTINDFEVLLIKEIARNGLIKVAGEVILS